MDMKKTAKKIAALVAGTTMLGATIMGATALDLSNYPAPFVTDGVFDGKIVVGAEAATSDVVGAIDLAASLQALATKTSDIAIPGAAGTASVTGDSAEFKTSTDVVGFEDDIGDVKATFTGTDLKALQDGVLNTVSGSAPVKQYLRFDNTTMSVLYAENGDTDKLSDFLKVDEGSTLFEFHLDFPEGVESDVDDGSLIDFEGEVVNMIGSPFTISTAEISGGNDITMTLLGGQVADVLRDGETKTYTIDGKDYEVTAVFIDSADYEAKLSVNGKMTRSLIETGTQVLPGEITVGVQSIMTNQREGMVEFYLGANKVVFTDSDFDTDTYEDGGVEVGTDDISDASIIMSGTNATGDFTLNYIKYKVLAEDDYYVAPGTGVKAVVETDNPGAFLTDTWDIMYAGIVKTGSSEIKLNSISGGAALELEFTNTAGDHYAIPFLTNETEAPKFGDEDDDFIFTEVLGDTANNSALNNTQITEDDYFMVSSKSDPALDTAVVKVYRYQSIDDDYVTFKDMATGNDFKVSYDADGGDLMVDGNAHAFWVSGEELAIDLDGDEVLTEGDYVTAVTKGGAIMYLGAQTISTAAVVTADATGSDFSVTTDGDRFIGSGSDEMSSFVISFADEEVTLGTFALGGSANDLVDDPDDDDLSKGYTGYGAYFEYDTDSEELFIDYPLTQRYPQVFVTAGVVDFVEGQASAAGTVKSTTLNPIAVGLAVLDTDVLPAGTNVIVVGGPCVNAKAAELMGNPAECAAGFTPGKAVIKLFSDKNALLVAGYSAQDTMGACYVLAEYADYKLSGTEVEVVVADLNTITVNKIA